MIKAFEDFKGFWQIERHITHDNGTVDHFIGLAQFAGEADEYEYHEKGEMFINTKAYYAERRYLWRKAGKLIQVYFDDGRFFHNFSFDKPIAHHDCPPDSYDVRYVFEHDHWQSHWYVTGPRKDYQMKTIYRRALDLQENMGYGKTN